MFTNNRTTQSTNSSLSRTDAGLSISFRNATVEWLVLSSLLTPYGAFSGEVLAWFADTPFDTLSSI